MRFYCIPILILTFLDAPLSLSLNKNSNKLNLSIELEDVKHLYGYVGDYVGHWFQINDNLYDTWEKVDLIVYSNTIINLISTSCDCNEKYIDRGDKESLININELNFGTNRFKTRVKLYEANGKYAGNTAEYEFSYNITLKDY